MIRFILEILMTLVILASTLLILAAPYMLWVMLPAQANELLRYAAKNRGYKWYDMIFFD